MSYTDTHEHSPIYVTELHDHQGNVVLPTTVVGAVYMPDKVTTLYDELNSMRGDTYTTEFKSDGSIVNTYSDGKTTTTTFKNDGSIEEICKYSDGSLYWKRVTVFNENGSISTTTTYAEMGA